MPNFLFLILLIFITTNLDIITADKGCGYRNLLQETGVFNEFIEKESHYGEFPWMIGIYSSISENMTDKFYCAGSLIHPSVILTTASCVTKGQIQVNTSIIRAGDSGMIETNELQKYQDRKISEIIIHKNYKINDNPYYYINNIALLIADKPFQISDAVNTICLPPADMQFEGFCVTGGWSTILQTSRKRNIFRRINLQILAHDTCIEQFKQISPMEEFHESFICAGGGVDQANCRIDRGSPLTCPISGNPRRYYQAGIAAWRARIIAEYTECDYYPTAFTSVSYYRNWIDEKFTERYLEKSYYNP